MGDYLIMSAKERKRKVILEDVKRGLLNLKDAAPRMEVGYRQAKRIQQRYRHKGDVGLVHGSRGKRSSHSYPQVFKDRILEVYQNRYIEFGPTFASEKLEEYEDIKINPETLRLWLLEAGLWHCHRKRKCYRQRRERRQRFGELLQIDGSDHHWFGKEHPRCCLLNIVDDATSKTLSQLDHGETCKVLLTTFMWWVKRYGVPKAVYVDLKNLYVGSPKKVDSKIGRTMNVFGRVCYLLDVKIIKAYSPQAKGRVERNHGIYQDRFVKELRLKGINRIDDANKFLKKSYLDKINDKFAKEPTSKEDAHCSAKAYGDLDQIFCWEYTRHIRNDFTIRFDNKFYQFSKQQSTRLQTKKKVIVHVHLDGDISFWYKGHKLNYQRIKAPEKQEKIKYPRKEVSSSLLSEIAKANKHKTPWSTFNPEWLKSRTTRSAAHV
jgi:transposase